MTKQQEVYILTLRFPDFSKDNVLKAARTLSKKPVVLNGRRLSHPLNSVFFAEYDKGNDEIQTIVLSIEKQIQEIYERNVQLYATASISKNPPFIRPDLLVFDELVLSTKPLNFGYETKLKRVPNIDTAIRMLVL